MKTKNISFSRFLKRLIPISLILFFVNFHHAFAIDVLVFEGVPQREDHSDLKNLSKKDLSATEAQALRLEISREDGQYRWKSSKSQELLYSEKKDSHFFISMAGDGFIEIRPDSESDLFYYKECVNTKDHKVTYYGTGDTLTL